MTSESVYNVIEQLKNTSSRLEKESILKQHASNDTLKRVCCLALDLLTPFYIKKIPTYTTTSPVESFFEDSNVEVLTLDDALNILEGEFATRKVTGGAASARLAEVLSKLSADDAKALEAVVNKDLACGVQVSTVNKIWPDLVRDYPVMLATAQDEDVMAAMDWETAIGQVKCDGMRFNAIVKGDTVTYYSRNGNPLEIHGALDEAFYKRRNTLGYDSVFDGELLVQRNGEILDRKTGNGICNKAVKGTMSPFESTELIAIIWDVIPVEYFDKSEVYQWPYKSRLTSLLDTSLHLEPHLYEKTQIVKTWDIRSPEEALAKSKELQDEGFEGLMIKRADGPWEPKRVKHQIKFKGVFDGTFKVIGWEEGTKKNTGKLGALVVETSDGLLECGVGTGLDDEDRLMKPEDVLGKFVHVRFNDVIKDKRKSKFKLFLPVYMGIEEDKSEADSLPVLFRVMNKKMPK